MNNETPSLIANTKGIWVVFVLPVVQGPKNKEKVSTSDLKQKGKIPCFANIPFDRQVI